MIFISIHLELNGQVKIRLSEFGSNAVMSVAKEEYKVLRALMANSTIKENSSEI
jgi:hypothetical protein